MGAPSFGSFGPAGPGFGSIQNISGPANNPTAFPIAPPPAGGAGIAPGGLAPGGLGMPGSQGLGNMVGVNLQQPQALANAPAPQAFRAPLPMPPPAALAAALAPAPAAAPQAAPSRFGWTGNPGGGAPPWWAADYNPGGNNNRSLFGLGMRGAGDAGAGSDY